MVGASCFPTRSISTPCRAGDISHIEVPGQHLIVLNSVEIALELLDKKSSVYSDRPVLQMGGELVGWKHSLGFLSYGDRFRCYRKYIHRVIGSRAVMSVYEPVEEIETRRFLKRVFAKPEQLQAHVRQYVVFVIVSMGPLFFEAPLALLFCEFLMDMT